MRWAMHVARLEEKKDTEFWLGILKQRYHFKNLGI
jgi:hypothetical protein